MFFAKPEATAERQEFTRRLSHKNMAPLWDVLGDIVTPEPRPQCVPAMWRYSELRPMLLEAGELITAKEAERRVLILENPGVPGGSRITQSLYAGVQLVLPGEIAPAHRHVAAALRFVLESDGGYTTVAGERIRMEPGDFILTPSWTWHDHGNPGQGPLIWLDGLDIPLVNHFDASFAEHGPAGENPSGPAQTQQDVFSYPYTQSREHLAQLYRNGTLDPCHGIKLQFVNPVTGRPPLATIGAFLQLLPRGFHGSPYRATDATIYCVVEGCGRSHIGGQTLAWQEHDIFVAPSWYPVRHEASKETVLFSFSDRPAQKVLGLWREQAPML